MKPIIHHILDQNFLLLPERGLIWIEKQTLIIADLHLGKITHFRKAGIGLPKEAEHDNLERLSFMIANNEVKRVLILGDLFHSDYNDQWPIFKSFIDAFPTISFVLVMGNHDILPAALYDQTAMQIYPYNYIEPPFDFSHIPYLKPSEYYNLCGHIHPGVVLKGKGMQYLKLPCFHFNSWQGVMPAFGVFTGSHKISPDKEDSVYTITDKQVMKVL